MDYCNQDNKYQSSPFCFLHAHPLAQLFLGEILQQARFFDGFADVIGVDGFGHFAFVFVAFGSAYLAYQFVFYLLEGVDE